MRVIPSCVLLVLSINEMRDKHVLARAARASADGRTVALIFGTIDFLELTLNWACHAAAAAVKWFVLVAMDRRLYSALQATSFAGHVVLLPRLRSENVSITLSLIHI